MDTDKLLQQIGKLFESNTAQLRKEMQASEERIKTELKEAIIRSQEDTIEVLTDLMNEGHKQHEERIQTIEEHLHISHPQ